MTSAGSGEKSVQDTHIYRGGAQRASWRWWRWTHVHTRRAPFLPAAAENQKIARQVDFAVKKTAWKYDDLCWCLLRISLIFFKINFLRNALILIAAQLIFHFIGLQNYFCKGRIASSHPKFLLSAFIFMALEILKVRLVWKRIMILINFSIETIGIWFEITYLKQHIFLTIWRGLIFNNEIPQTKYPLHTIGKISNSVIFLRIKFAM